MVSKLCLEYCPYNTADYLTKECMTNCEFNQFWINQISNGMTIKLCLSNCSQVDYTNYYTSEKECVITWFDPDSAYKGTFTKKHETKHIIVCVDGRWYFWKECFFWR